MSMHIIALRRDDIYSPNLVEKDRLILQDVCKELAQKLEGADIYWADEAEWSQNPIEADLFVSMARSPEALGQLAKMEQKGCKAVNGAQAVMNCQRSKLDRLMRREHIAMPPLKGTHGYWLKRGDAAAQSKNDIRYCADEQQLNDAIEEFRRRGIVDMVTSAHVVGDLVKFYGVGHRMFRLFYPTDDGISKFGDEARNGEAHHYAFSEDGLRAEVQRLADLTGVVLYGGDAIIDPQGHYSIIDFNDWPSFSRCREDAARQGAEEIIELLKGAHND
jgi:hypothetical protein